MKIRGDVHWLADKSMAYLKIGDQIYSLLGFPVEVQERYWTDIKNGYLEKLEYDEDFKTFFEFLKSKGAFEEDDIWRPYLLQQGIEVGSLQEIISSKKIAVLGDEDLINRFHSLYGNTFVNTSRDVVGCDFGVLLIRSHKQEEVVKYNKLLTDSKIEFIPLLAQAFSYLIGPLVVPGETVCLNCVMGKKEKNLFYRKENNLFLGMNDREITPMPEPVVDHGIVTLAIELIKRILTSESLALESGVLNTIIEFSMLENKIEQHNIIKDPDCTICFPQKNINKNVIWMGKTK